jgi:hypothetical protein
MSVYSGPAKPSGLVLSLDSANRKSILRITQSSNILVDPHTWTAGSGGFTGYAANGGAAEQNRRQITDDPWGGTSMIWETLPDAPSDADGGWNTSSYTIDPSFTYRFSVWVRRPTLEVGGTFYMGMNPAPIRNDNNAVQSNPYFTYPAQSSLAVGQWYLVVGHCFFQGYSGGVAHPDSGWWTRQSGKISTFSFGNVGAQDVRWNPGTTSALHRTYHYYTTNVNSRLQFAFPRLDKCDGTEPTIQELLNIGESYSRNLIAPNAAYGDNVNLQNFTFDDRGAFIFDGAARWINITGFTLSGNRTVSFWSRPAEIAIDWRSVIDSESGRYIIGTNANRYQLYTVNAWRSGPLATLNVWQHIVFSTQGTVTTWYKNGVAEGSYTGTVPAISGNTIIGARFARETAYHNGRLSNFEIYNRALSASEVQDNFNALRSRYGI